MTQANIDTSSIDSLLDGTLDDLSDVPAFKPFPAGTHLCTIKWEVKPVNNKPSIELSITAIETLELKNTETDTPVKAGDSTSVLFQLVTKDGQRNEIAEGQWKALLAPLAAHFGTKSNRETMEASNGAQVALTTGIRKSKKDENGLQKEYTSVDNLLIA